MRCLFFGSRTGEAGAIPLHKDIDMKRTHYAIAGAAMLALCAAGEAWAGDATIGDLELYPSLYGSSAIELAQNDAATTTATPAEAATSSNASSAKQEPFEESAFTANKLHGYLGWASLASAALAGMSAPDNEGAVVAPGQPIKKGFHHYAGIAAAALGGAAVVSGLVLHADDLTPDFLDPDTAHMLLGILGTAAYAYAVSKGPKVTGKGAGSHAAAGMAGAGLMLTAIYLEF